MRTLVDWVRTAASKDSSSSRVCGSSSTSLTQAAESARSGERVLGLSQSLAAISVMCPSCAMSIEKCPCRLTLPGPPASP